jgi:crotonobetainyl-CoA:carnitine CoA-transferase CaiB-like acyl-CoA transferase
VEKTGACFLDGVRIVEVGSSDTLRITGMLLADQGADVVRIAQAPDTASLPLHDVTDRRKKTARCDPGTPEQITAVRTLFERADVVLEDIGPSLLSRFRMVQPIIDSVIHCLITPFASEDKTAEAWTEETVSALSGLYEPLGGMGSPRFYDLHIASVIAALHAANAVAMALVGRSRFGCNYAVRVPVDRCALFSQVLSIMIRSKAPTVWEPFRMWSSPFMGIWKTAGDEYLYLHIGMPRHLRSFLFLLDKLGFGAEKKAIKSLLEKPSKRDPAMLAGVREALGILRVLKELFLRKKAEEWEEILGKEGLCCCKIRSFDEWRVHDQVVQSGEILACRLHDGRTLNVPGPVFESEIPGGSAGGPSENQEVPLGECREMWPAREPAAAEQCRKLPLEGLKVLDVSRVIAGPFAGRIMAEYGAEVLQVSLRTNHLSWEEPFHVVFNAGKDSVTIDYSSPEGKDAFKRIVKRFEPDIILHNFIEGAARKIGLDYESCKKWNERIIYIDLQGFNGKGPWAGRPGFEQNVQAASGILSSYSDDGTPRILPVPVNDLSAGLIAAFGAALSIRELAGNKRGNRITCYLSMPSILLQLHRLNGGDGLSRFSGYFKASDGCFLLSADRSALQSLGSFPGFAGVDLSHASDLTKALAPVFRNKPAQWWIAQVKSAGLENRIRIVPRQKLGEILKRDLSSGDPLFSYRSHEGIGNVLFAYSPIRLSPVGIKKIGTAKFIGGSTRAWAELAGFDPARHSPKVPEHGSGSGLFTGIKRMLWFVSQLKWLAVIVYRQRALRRKTHR